MAATESDFLFQKLNSVRRRLQTRQVLDGLLTGLFWGAVLGIIIAAGSAAGLRVPGWVGWVVPVMSILACGLYLGTRPISDADAGALIDAAYGLKDRIVTAMAFSVESNTDPMHVLQLEDAIENARQVDPRVVVPRLMPERWLRSVVVAGGWLLTVSFALSTLRDAERLSAGSSNTAVTALSNGVQKTIVASLRRRAADASLTQTVLPFTKSADTSQQLAALASEIEALGQEEPSPAHSRHTALARLSKMQAAIVRTQSAFQRSTIEPQLKALGRALAADLSTREIGRHLAEGNVAAAAAALERLDLPSLGGPERSTFARKLRQFAQRFKVAELAELATATDRLRKQIETDSPPQLSQNALPRLLREYAARWSADQYLQSQLRAIGDARAALTIDDLPRDPRRGETSSPSLLTGEAGVSTHERRTPSGRDLKRLTGKVGGGPSTWKTTLVNRKRQSAERRLAFDEFSAERRFESAIEIEALPLAYRQTIWLYFQGVSP